MALKEMTTTIDCERHTMDFGAVPEYLREAQLPTRDAAVSMSSSMLNQRLIEEDSSRSNNINFEPDTPKSEELEVLWPGVHHEHHDFVPPPKRSASFYLSVGFAAGAIISLAGVFGFFSVSKIVTAAKNPADNKILVAGVPAPAAGAAAPAVAAQTTPTGDTLVPAAPQYQVQAGDTLAGIAYKNYKRVSPRLLDEIVRANGMRSANVLSLGQKLTLPEYHPSNQIAATTTGTLQ